MSYRLLIAEDGAVMADLLSELSREVGFVVEHHSQGKEALAAMVSNPADALLAGIRMPGLSGIELIEAVAENHPGLPMAIITGYATVPDVVRGFRAGAMDLITKPFDNSDVQEVLARFKRSLDRERRVEALEERLQRLDTNQVSPESRSRAMQEVMGLVDKVAGLDTPVLLAGETGTGKGILARAIHAASPCRDGPWFSVNCGALADSVAESELFGYEPGAFTGASKRKRGILELAHGGTLFLDEINSASSSIQTRLLDFVQARTLRRVGGEQSIEVDVRLITSNQDLQEAVQGGDFREDPWYRLNVFPITVPPLRQRLDDIISLAEHFLLRIAQSLDRPARQLSEDAEQQLLAYRWPGNVRELENCIHRAVVLADGQIVERQHLSIASAGAGPKSMAAPWSVDASLLEIEKHWIELTLKRCDGNKSKTARRLGIDVSTLHRKLREKT